MQERSRDLSSRRAVSCSRRACSSSDYTSRTTCSCEDLCQGETLFWRKIKLKQPLILPSSFDTMWPRVSAAQDLTSISSWSSSCSTCRPGVRQHLWDAALPVTQDRSTHTHSFEIQRFLLALLPTHQVPAEQKHLWSVWNIFWVIRSNVPNASHYQSSLHDSKYQRTNQRGQHAGSLDRNLSLARRVSVCQFCSGMGSYVEAEGAPGWMLGRRSSSSPQQAISQAVLLTSPAGSGASLHAKRPKAPKHGSTHVSDCASKRPNNRPLCSQQWLQRTKETYSQTQPSRSSASYKQTDIYSGDLQLQECLNHSTNAL